MLKKRLINKNSLPFFILAIIHIVMLLFVVVKKKPKNLWSLLLTNMGFAYLFEYVILNLFHGYQYKPSILKKHYLDKIFGAILSQGLYVPISATFLTVLNLKWYWKISFSVIYYFIEKLFIQLKVYKEYWWRPIFTLFFLNIYFYISKGYYRALYMDKRWALSLAHYFSVAVIGVTLRFVCVVKRQIRFGLGAFHSWNEHFIVVPLYSLVITSILVKNASREGIVYRFLMVIYQLALDLFLHHLGILKIKFNKMWSIGRNYILMTVLSRYIYLKLYKDQKATM